MRFWLVFFFLAITGHDLLGLSHDLLSLVETEAKPAVVETVEEDDEGPVVIVGVTATWCAPCKTMKPVWEDLLNEGYDVRLADVDKYEYWRKKTDKIPATFFVTKKRVLGSFVGVQTKDQLKLQYKKIVDGR